MFRIEGGPGSETIPLVIGVDDFISKSLLWTLANAESDPDEVPWYKVEPAEIAALFEPSLAILRQDVATLGGTSKFWPDHVAQKWVAATEKAGAAVRQANEFVERLTQATQDGAEKRTSQNPYVVQVDDRYYVLDERGPVPLYQGPLKGVALRGICQRVWTDSEGNCERPLDIPIKDSSRAMQPAEIVEAYGATVVNVVVDYTAQRPYVDDVSIILPRQARPIPTPEADPAVAEWLDLLGGPSILDWIAWAARERCDTVVPALALIGGSHVGKGLLAEGLAMAAGQEAASKLARAMSKFGSVLADGPILFGDEGLPRDHGVPQTQEFREIVTRTRHLCEQKGIDRSMIVRGAPRVILAANKSDRLFSNVGNMNANDIDALMRRLFVVEIEGAKKIERCRIAAVGLGSRESDPVRLERVARHLRHIQTTHRCLPPEPRGGNMARELRTTGGRSREVLDAIEDSIGTADWTVEVNGTLYLQPAALARRTGEDPSIIGRILAPYVVSQTRRYRGKPGSEDLKGAAGRWVGLSLDLLRKDAIEV